MKIDTALIGLGKIGMGYDYFSAKNIKSHANAIKKNKNFNLISAVDNSLIKRQLFQKKFKIKAFNTISNALNISKPKLVIIATPIKSHYSILKSIIKKKYIKYIICEKPLTDKVSKTKNILKKINQKKKALFVNYIRQCDPIIEKTLNNNKNILLENSTKIKVFYYENILNNASHFILLFTKLFGYPKKIQSKNTKNKKKLKNFRYDFDLVFKKNNKVSFFSVSKKQKINHEIVIDTKIKKIKFAFSSNKILIYNNKKKSSLKTHMHYSQKNVLDNVLLHIKNKKNYPVLNKDVLNTEKIIDKIVSAI